ncbi:hypothetical protein H1P_920019 [Hyella patelloides LEGE 07179]|uniref:Uncharacterized protein n=1 Tax=Hyella patelloides LEGE 07179 TaxID=945734 RepID=A0A563W5K9_9CYAN|nr:hypothetical protein [Hyella patelloides]VEP18823.1 hypothetical protein H1P_920019 [Hyella patelloides LEGE 07179]
MISAYKLTTVLLTALLLLVGCNSLPKITISIGDNTSKDRDELESHTIESPAISESKGSKEIGQEDRSNRTDANEVITRSSSSSACSATNINQSNKISLLKKSNGRQTFSGSGTYISGLDQFDAAPGFDKVTDDLVFAGSEAVFGFQDGRCATFDTITFRATGMRPDFNDKEFELLVGNDSPTGKFESIGKFIVDGQTPTQTFNFDPLVGRYFQVKKLTRENFSDSVYVLQLWGTLE